MWKPLKVGIMPKHYFTNAVETHTTAKYRSHVSINEDKAISGHAVEQYIIDTFKSKIPETLAYDTIINEARIDIKNKVTTFYPTGNFNSSVYLNVKDRKETDWYLFTDFNPETKAVYIKGIMKKDDFKRRAKKYTKGVTSLTNGNGLARADSLEIKNYNLLQQHSIEDYADFFYKPKTKQETFK